MRLTGAIEQPRIRFWSTLLTVPTDQGLLWFKENSPGQSFEAALLAELGRLVPDHVVVPLAVNTERGWLLSPDHGETLRTLGATDEKLWARVVAEFADLQRRLTPHAAELAATGLPSMPPTDAPDYVADQVDRLRRLPAGDPQQLDEVLADRILGALSDLRKDATLLAQGPVPLSLEHNDLHHNNAFIPATGESTLRFFDFADSLWAHPFSSLRITINVMGDEWEAEDDDPRITYVVESYLEVWSDLAARAELRELMSAALKLGPIHRFESWRRVLVDADDASIAEYAEMPRGWLTKLSE